jgi:hypothetical protein
MKIGKLAGEVDGGDLPAPVRERQVPPEQPGRDQHGMLEIGSGKNDIGVCANARDLRPQAAERPNVLSRQRRQHRKAIHKNMKGG